MSTCYIQKNGNNIDYHSNELIPGIDFPSSLCVGQSDIPCSSAARSRAVMCDSQYRLKEQVNCQIAYLEVRRRTVSFLKPPKLSFPFLFSLGLIIVMLSLLALLRFSLIKLTSDQLLSSPHLPTTLLYSTISTG